MATIDYRKASRVYTARALAQTIEDAGGSVFSISPEGSDWVVFFKYDSDVYHIEERINDITDRR